MLWNRSRLCRPKNWRISVKNGLKYIRATAYNGAHMVLEYSCKFETFQNDLLAYGSQCDLPSWAHIGFGCITSNPKPRVRAWEIVSQLTLPTLYIIANQSLYIKVYLWYCGALAYFDPKKNTLNRKIIFNSSLLINSIWF